MDAEIIIIIVAVALSILSGINKNKKKKQQQANHPHHNEPSHEQEDDPWSTIRRYIEEAQTATDQTDIDDAPQYQQGRAEALPYSQAPVTKPVSRHPEVTDESFTDRLNRYATSRKERAQEPKEPSGSAERKLAAQPEGTAPLENILDDFNIAKAVVYSEILKPKYDEF